MEDTHTHTHTHTNTHTHTHTYIYIYISITLHIYAARHINKGLSLNIYKRSALYLYNQRFYQNEMAYKVGPLPNRNQRSQGERNITTESYDCDWVPDPMGYKSRLIYVLSSETYQLRFIDPLGPESHRNHNFSVGYMFRSPCDLLLRLGRGPTL